jgi:xanthine dehydrogenase/oxidase
MIVAKTKLIAQRAAAAVLVTYDLLPMVLTLEEAIAQKSFHPQYKRQISRGLPIDEALAGAEIVLEGRTRMGGQEHFYLETMSCLAIPKHESGEIEVYASTQAITDAQVSDLV